MDLIFLLIRHWLSYVLLSCVTTTIKLRHNQLEKDVLILESGVPEKRWGTFISVLSPPYLANLSLVFRVHYKGRDKQIVEVDLKLDDLLEKQHDNVQRLNLEYAQLNANKASHLLNKYFHKC